MKRNTWPPRQKVLCYVTREHTGSIQVLVFEHLDYPEAGVQVPAGSIEPAETSEEAALRESLEESGVEELKVRSYIGKFLWWHEQQDEYHERHVFHLTTSRILPEYWEHTVSAGKDDKGLRFALYWLGLNDAERILSGNQGDYLRLIQ